VLLLGVFEEAMLVIFSRLIRVNWATDECGILPRAI